MVTIIYFKREFILVFVAKLMRNSVIFCLDFPFRKFGQNKMILCGLVTFASNRAAVDLSLKAIAEKLEYRVLLKKIEMVKFVSRRAPFGIVIKVQQKFLVWL